MDVDWVGEAVLCADASAGVGEDAFDIVDEVLGEAKIPEGLEEFVLVNGIEGAGEVDIEAVNVLAVQASVFQAVDEGEELAFSVAVLAEAFLLFS